MFERALLVLVLSPFSLSLSSTFSLSLSTCFLSCTTSTMSSSPRVKTTALTHNEEYCTVAIYNPLTKVTQVDLWQKEKCNKRIKGWEAREIQLEVRVGAKTWMPVEMGSSVEARAQRRGLARFLTSTVLHNSGVSPSRRRTERAVRRGSWGKVHTVFTEGDDIRVLSAIVSFKTGRRRVVQNSSQVMGDSCEQSVSSFRGCLFSESGQSQFKRGQFIRTGCLMMTGIERWESYEGNKRGQLYKDCSVYKKRITEKGNKPKGKRVETTAVAQGVMTTRGTTPPLSPNSESSIEQRGCKKVHWTERGFNTLIESSRLFLVMSILSLKMKCDIDCVHFFGWLRSESTAKAITAIWRSFTAGWSNEEWNVLEAGKLARPGRWQIVFEQVGWSFPFPDHTSARGWRYVERLQWQDRKKSLSTRSESVAIGRWVEIRCVQFRVSKWARWEYMAEHCWTDETSQDNST